MVLLKYTVPADLPCYTGWDFPVYPGTFLFFMDAMLDTFRQRIENNAKYVHMWSSKSGIHKEHFDCIDVLKWLKSHNDENEAIVQWDELIVSEGLAHTALKGNRILVTASTAELRNFFAEHAHEIFTKESQIVYRRRPKQGD